MKRELEMVIKLPKERESDFRVMIVVNGGQIVSCVDTEPSIEEKEE